MITPQENYPKLAKVIGIPDLFLKREDLHPYGSHKGRSIPVMIDHYYKDGERRFAISSSGNAALAAAIYIREINTRNANPVELDIFVGNHITTSKLEYLQKIADKNIRILKKERPLQALIQVSQEGVRSLRQSTDDTALVGYKSLAEELSLIKNLSAVFVGTSSGTTAQALAQYFLENNLHIQVHIVQTSSCHPLSEAFASYDGPEEDSIADAIVDRSANRKSVLSPFLEKTGGYGWIATNDDILVAQELASKYASLDISTNSALSIVGLMKAVYINHKIEGAVVCILGGN